MSNQDICWAKYRATENLRKAAGRLVTDAIGNSLDQGAAELEAKSAYMRALDAAEVAHGSEGPVRGE